MWLHIYTGQRNKERHDKYTLIKTNIEIPITCKIFLAQHFTISGYKTFFLNFIEIKTEMMCYHVTFYNSILYS